LFAANQTENHNPAHKSDPQQPTWVEGRVIVKPKQGVAAHRLKSEHAQLGAKIRREFKGLGGLQVIELPPGLSVAAAVKQYKASGLVEYAEPDYIVHADTMPNDPKFLDGTLWGLNNTGQSAGVPDADIDAPEAWDTLFAAPDVIVAVIDTGVRYTHQDLAANIWTNPGETPANGIDDDGNGYVDDVYGMNAITGSGDPMDDNGHGTHVAGTIGGVGNNGIGVVGVAWQVQIMACKFLGSSGSGNTSDAIEAIDYARLMGADVMNNSWGGGGFSQALLDAITAARDAGIIFVASAGNSAANNDATPYYPACYDVENVVAVAATDRSEQLASFSSYGLGSVELGAPGVQIYSSYGSSDTSYASLNGTSMSSPHVAGAMALVRARFPSASYADVIRRVIAGTDPTASLAARTISGGRLNLDRALVQDPLPYFTASPIRGLSPLTVSFTDGSVGTVSSRTWNFGDGSAASTLASPTYTYTTNGVFNATLTISGPGGTFSRSRTIGAFAPVAYAIEAATFDWIDPTSMPSLILADDGVSVAQALPFPFKFYGEWYTVLYVGANGLLGFEPSGLAKYSNGDLPSALSPEAMICPYWDDLDPPAGGTISIGTVGTSPNRKVVVSWVGVPHYGDPGGTTNGLVFQTVLEESSNDIVLQYQEIRPGTTYGSGISATIGIENQTGELAAKYSFNGSTPINNGDAIRFTTGEVTPPDPNAVGVLSVDPGSGLSSSGLWTGPFSPTLQTYTLSNTGSNALAWAVGKSQSWVSLSATSGVLAPGATTTVAVTINGNANWLDVGTYSDTVTFSNLSNGNGNTARTVTLTVLSPPVLSISPSYQDFGNVSVGGSADRTYTVRNIGGGILNGTASASAPYSVVSGANYSIPAGSNSLVVVRFTPTSEGSFSQTVAFNGGGVLNMPVTGTGVVAAISVTPSTYHFGSVGIGSSANATFTLSNLGGVTISGSASVSAPFSVVSGGTYTVAAGQSTSVTVRFSPPSQGTFTQTATFSGGGGASSTVTGTGAIILNAPSNLTGSSSGSSASIWWTDNSAGEESFLIERQDRPLGAGSWSSWSQVAEVGANTTTFAETGLQKGYHNYRVRARFGTTHSAYSNTAEVKTR
jgi:subtilisin family serine protease